MPNSRYAAGRVGAFIMFLVLVVAACSDNGTPAVLGHGEPGPDPFLSLAGIDTPEDLRPILERASEAAAEAEAALGDLGNDSDATRAKLDARLQATTDVLAEAGHGLIRPRSIVGVGLLPDDARETCNLEGLVDAYSIDRSAALAFASVHGLRTSAIPEYLESLTAGYLIDDTRVINHSFSNDLAKPHDTTLQAGTAVLVDADGLVRVRCRGGSPLLPAQVDLDGRIVENAAFADEVADSDIADDVPSLIENSIDGLFTNDPRQAIGPPNMIALSLGDDPESSADACRFQVTLRFVDNRLVNGPGPDLQVVELGRTESMFVSVGTELGQLRFVGEISGGTTTIDLSPVAAPGEEFELVRLCDGPDTDSEVPGSDVDAVAALNSIRS